MSTVILEDSFGDNIRIRLALHIIENVVPKILSRDTITERISIAYAWYKILCETGRCPDISDNYLEWGDTDLKKIADSLLKLARSLLGNFIK